MSKIVEDTIKKDRERPIFNWKFEGDPSFLPKKYVANINRNKLISIDSEFQLTNHTLDSSSYLNRFVTISAYDHDERQIDAFNYLYIVNNIDFTNETIQLQRVGTDTIVQIQSKSDKKDNIYVPVTVKNSSRPIYNIYKIEIHNIKPQTILQLYEKYIPEIEDISFIINRI